MRNLHLFVVEIMLSTKTEQMEPQINASSSSAFKAIPAC